MHRRVIWVGGPPAAREAAPAGWVTRTVSDAEPPLRPPGDRTVLQGRDGDRSGAWFYGAAGALAPHRAWWMRIPSLNSVPDAAVARATAVVFHGTLSSREQRFVRTRLGQEWWRPPGALGWWLAAPGAPQPHAPPGSNAAPAAPTET